MTLMAGPVGGLTGGPIASGSPPSTGAGSPAPEGIATDRHDARRPEPAATPMAAGAVDTAAEDRLAGSGSRGEVDFLAKLEQQRADRRAWAAAVQAAERAAAMAAMLKRPAPAEPGATGAPHDMGRDPEAQRQLDVALRVVRMPDATGLRFELRL